MQRIPSRQILEIRMLNDSKLKYFDDLPDIQLVQLLKNADNVEVLKTEFHIGED